MKNWSTIIGLCQKKRFLLHPSTDYFVICPRINSLPVERLLIIIGALNSLQNSFIDCFPRPGREWELRDLYPGALNGENNGLSIMLDAGKKVFLKGMRIEKNL